MGDYIIYAIFLGAFFLLIFFISSLSDNPINLKNIFYLMSSNNSNNLDIGNIHDNLGHRNIGINGTEFDIINTVMNSDYANSKSDYSYMNKLDSELTEDFYSDLESEPDGDSN